MPDWIPPDRPEAWAYFLWRQLFWALGTLGVGAILATFTRRSPPVMGRIGARLGAAAWLVVPALWVVLVLGLLTPLSFLSGFVLRHAYGLSRMSFLRWLWVRALGIGLVSLLVGATAWLPMFLRRRSPKTWWLWAGGLSVPVLAFLFFGLPLFVAPLFHEFHPFTHQSLGPKIRRLASRSGLDPERIYEVRIGKDTKAVNAYVAGMGSSHRVVLWDTLIQSLKEDEVEFVMAHEIGHYRLHHLGQGLAWGSLGAFAFFLAFHLFYPWVRRSWTGPVPPQEGTLEELPSALLLAWILLVLGEPFGLVLSRQMEHEADRFALELTQAPEAGARAFLALGKNNLAVSDPGWLHRVLRASHPSLKDRIEFCLSYPPARGQGEARYRELFDAEAPP